ncbi:MAG: hypothetical protein ABR585_00605 [Gemmatimonadaceae bacterium]
MTALRITFLTAFIIGLVLAVFTMLNGIERRRGGRVRPPSPFFNLPAVAAFAVGFGAVGYPLASRTTLRAWVAILVGFISGALAVSGMITLLARWALHGAAAPGAAEDEIQGQLAVVTRQIGAGDEGQISYEQMGRRVFAKARSSNTHPLTTGTEVVIDRIEEGVAVVEEWASVEQRL